MRSFTSRLVGSHPLALIAGGCMVALTIPTYRLLDAQRKNTGILERTITKQGEETRKFVGQWLTENLMPEVQKLNSRVDSLPQMATTLIDKHATVIEDRVTEQVASAIDVVDGRVTDGLKEIDDTLGEVKILRTKIVPILDNLADITDHAEEGSKVLFARNALPAQILGAVAAAKVTLGQTAQTMKKIEEATPEMLEIAKDVGKNVKETTKASTEASQNTARVMGNFAEATKPLPRGVRVGLQVAGPLAQVASYVILMLSTLGVL